MNTELKNLLEYVKGKEIEQGLDLSKLETLVDALVESAPKFLSTEQLKAELKARGYFTDNLWQEADVDTVIDNYNEENGTSIELDKDAKQYILYQTLAGDGVMTDINDQLGYVFDAYLEDEGLIPAEEN